MNEVPTKTIGRHGGNWGFVMDAVWSFQASFKLPARGIDPSLEDAGLSGKLHGAQEESMLYNMAIPVDLASPSGGSGPGEENMAVVDIAGRKVQLPRAAMLAILLSASIGAAAAAENQDEKEEKEEKQEKQEGNEVMQDGSGEG